MKKKYTGVPVVKTSKTWNQDKGIRAFSSARY